MATFTVLTSELVEQIISNYPVGTLREFHPLEGGLANSSIKVVTETGTYVLSVCDEKDFSEISRLCSILNYLDKADFPTTKVIATHDGKFHLTHDGKPVYVKQYIDGGVISPLDKQHVFQVGASLARLHAISPHIELLSHFSYGVESFAELEGVPDDNDYTKWLFECREQIVRGCSNALPRGFIHGDLFFDNMLFVDGRLAAVLDFEEACEYYLIFDIGMAAIGCCVVGGQFSLDLTASLVAGYQTVRMLEPVERELLQRHVEYGAVATSFWRYRQYNVRNPDPKMKDHYRAMYDLACQVAAIDAEQFVEALFV